MASQGLGVGHGSMIDKGAGNVEYRQTGKLLPAFQVNVGDVTGFSVRKPTKQDKKNGVSSLQRVLVIMGSGTELATVGVNATTPGKIEAWIRAHASFRGNVPQATSAATGGGLAEELTKLAALRDSGILSPEEFDTAKARLLGTG